MLAYRLSDTMSSEPGYYMLIAGLSFFPPEDLRESRNFCNATACKIVFRCVLPALAGMAMPALYSMADGIFVGHFSGQDTDIRFLSSVFLDRRMAVRISHRDGMPCSFSSHFLAGHFSVPLYLYFFYGRFVGIDRGLSDASCCRVFQCCYPGFYHTCKSKKMSVYTTVYRTTE